jgi:hypothetical protein
MLKAFTRVFSPIILITLLMFLGCTNQEPSHQDTSIQFDSLRLEIRKLQTLILDQNQRIDSLSSMAKPETIVVKKVIQLAPATPTKEPTPTERETNPRPAPPQTVTVLTLEDTIKHFYINKKISVVITPKHDGKRLYQLYDLYGNLTYEMEEIRLSYSQSINLSFHENGAVKKAKIHFNPGASLHWYETEIIFDTTNEPLLKTETQMPVRSALQSLEKPMFWDKKEKRWIKQEIIKETISPPGN